VCLDSPPGTAAAGFCVVEWQLPVKPPVHRPAGVRSAAEVKRDLDRQRPSAARRGYGSRWRKARAAFLARHPLCAACRAQGRVVQATVVDHVVPHRSDQRLFWDETNWAPACKPCHDAKTAREGRWG
jgi:5-methylcytosine-specific restriction enzyme A